MMHKLAFAAVSFGQLDFALNVLRIAEEIKPDPHYVEQLGHRQYYRFLRELVESTRAASPLFPISYAEKKFV